MNNTIAFLLIILIIQTTLCQEAKTQEQTNNSQSYCHKVRQALLHYQFDTKFLSKNPITNEYEFDYNLDCESLVQEFIQLHTKSPIYSCVYLPDFDKNYEFYELLQELYDLNFELICMKNSNDSGEYYAKSLYEIYEKKFNQLGLDQTFGKNYYNKIMACNRMNQQKYTVNKFIEQFRKLLGMKSVSSMPSTYQYFNKHLKQITSQFDQDGVIQAIFDLIGTTDKYFVEIGGGSDMDNTMNLRTMKGWKGILFNSGGYYMKESTKEFTKVAWVHPNNVNELFQKYNVQSEFDFLSIDIDSNDYWVWKALDNKYRPRVVSVEFNPNFNGSVAATIPEGDEFFTWQDYNKYYGASIKAIFDLAKSKGYEYVYHMTFTDIFFVRSDLLPENMRGMDIKDTYDPFPLHYIYNISGKKYQILN